MTIKPNAILQVVSVLTATVVVIGLLVLGLSTSSANAADEDDIKAVIEESYAIYFAACRLDEHDNIDANKEALESYWSSATRTTSQLATRMAHQVAVYSTPLPGPMQTGLASLRQTATANPTLVPAEQIEALAEFAAGTPNWRASDTPLEERWQDIDNCQATYDQPDHIGMMLDGGITGYAYDDISINGDIATVAVRIDRWYEMIVNSTSAPTVTQTFESEQYYKLKKVGDDWVIVSLMVKPKP